MTIKKILIWATAIFTVILAGLIIMISTLNLSDYLVKIQDIVSTKTGRQLSFNEDAKVSLGLTTKIKLNDVTFANAEGLKKPHMFVAQSIEAKIEVKPLLKKKIVIKQLVLKKASILLEKDQEDHWNYLFAAENKGSDETVKKSVTADQEIQKPLAQDSNDADRNFMDIIINELVIEDSQILINEDRSTKRPPIKIDQFRATLNGLNNPIDLDVVTRFDELNISLKGTIGALSRLIETDQLTPFNFNCIINESDLDVDGNITNLFQSDKPGLEVAIASNKLDMVSLFKEDSKKITENRNLKPKSKSKPKKDVRVFSTSKIDNEFLSRVDLKADIDVKELILKTFSMSNLKTKVELEKGVLQLKPFSATLFKGNLKGDLQVNAIKNGINVASNINVKNLDIKNLIKQFGLKKELQGLVNVDWQLKGQGQTLSSILATLDGPVSILMNEGKIETGFIQSLGADMFTSVLGFLTPFGEDIPYNALNCAATRLEFEKGIGSIKVLLVDLPKMTAAGVGKVNLKNETLDIIVKPSPKKGIGTKDLGKINLSFSNLTKAFKVQGKMTNPEVKIDHSETTKNVIKTIGGIALWGPAGIITSLIGASKSDQDPCPCALAIARTGDESICKTNADNMKDSKNVNEEKTSNPLKKVFSIFN